MVSDLKVQPPGGRSLGSLVRGFILTKKTEGKSPATVKYYQSNLRRLLWFADREGWPEDVRLINEWHIREFLGYVGSETERWGLTGNGSETSRPKASHSTIRHYFVTCAVFFSWVVREGFLADNPMARVKVTKARPKVVSPYDPDELRRMLAICDYDYNHSAKFLGSRNKALILLFLDTGMRLSEVTRMKLRDVNSESGYLKVLGKGNKERVVRIGKVTQKAVWRYLIHRPNDGRQEVWLTEEGRPMSGVAIQCLIRRVKERAGVETSGSVHRFRHTFALSFLREDGNVFNLQYLLGHSSLEMVRRYTAALGMEEALKAHERASPADRLGL